MILASFGWVIKIESIVNFLSKSEIFLNTFSPTLISIWLTFFEDKSRKSDPIDSQE